MILLILLSFLARYVLLSVFTLRPIYSQTFYSQNILVSQKFTLTFFALIPIWSQIIIFYNLVKLVVLAESKQTDKSWTCLWFFGLIWTNINKFWSRYRFYLNFWYQTGMRVIFLRAKNCDTKKLESKKLRANWSESKMLWEQIGLRVKCSESKLVWE